MTETTLVDVDAQAFIAAFDRDPVRLSHRLVGHDLFARERLAQLADALPPGHIEHNLGDLPDVVEEREIPRLGASPGEIVRTLETNGCWMVLKWVEHDPEYRALLGDALAEVTDLVADAHGGVIAREGFVVLSVTGSIAPSHIEGTKTIEVGRFADPVTETSQLERFHAGVTRNVPVSPSDAARFEPVPGEGVYVPVHRPHLVRVGPDPAVSFSVTFYTGRTDREAAVHKPNAQLRRRRVTPSELGTHPRRDQVKQALWRGSRRVFRLARRHRR